MDFYKRGDIRADDNIRAERMPFILSQYAASPAMNSILRAFRKEMSPRGDCLLFFENIFNVDTAKGIGLDIWGRIVAIGRTIEDPLTGYSLTLDDERYRRLILYKALSNINQSTIPALSTLINILYPKAPGAVINIERPGAYADGSLYNRSVMKIRWVFETFFDAEDLAVFRVAGTLNRGAGVGWGLYAIDPAQVFGFDGQELQPFNQGVFDPVGIIDE
jgi:hypothetical protein